MERNPTAPRGAIAAQLAAIEQIVAVGLAGALLQWFAMSLFAVAISTCGAAAVAQEPRSIVRPNMPRNARQAARPGPAAPMQLTGTGPPPVCAMLAAAWTGQPCRGGQLDPIAWGNTATVARDGSIAFAARITGTSANQGIFVATANGLRAIAIGCGNGGGSGVHGSCGDPAPGGGTFAGFFLGSAFAPAIDDDGNVLFLADLAAAPTPRGLFAFVGATQSIVRIAAVGDAAPAGGQFTAIGPGAIAAGTAVFVARTATGGGAFANADLYWWRNGVLQRLAAAGDALPGGGTVAQLATESLLFADGTSVPIGPLPAIDACGRAAYRVIASGTRSGIVVRDDVADSATATWALRLGDPAPGGGTFAAVDAPMLNGNGALAVFADLAGAQLGAAAWFVGRPGAMRRALGFFDPVDGGQCLGLAVSRGPMVPVDADETLVLWCDLDLAGGADRIVASRADGTLRVLARRGEPTPLGGSFGSLCAWPARASTGRTTISAAIAGGSAATAHCAAIDCEPVVAVDPCVRRGGTLRIDDQGPAGSSFGLGAATAVAIQPLPPWGTLQLAPPVELLLWPQTYPGPQMPHRLLVPVPDQSVLLGTAVHFQSLAVLGSTGRLTNRATAVVR